MLRCGGVPQLNTLGVTQYKLYCCTLTNASRRVRGLHRLWTSVQLWTCVLVCVQIRSSMRLRDNAVMDLCVCLCADQEFHEREGQCSDGLLCLCADQEFHESEGQCSDGLVCLFVC